MAWTAKLTAKSIDPTNPQNIRVTLEFVNGKETISQTTHGTTITAEYLQKFARAIISNLTERDTALATLPEIGAEITPDAAPDVSEQQAYQRQLRKLQTLLSVKTDDAALLAEVETLKGQVETYIKANPDAI